MNLQKHIREGWTVQDFIDELEPIFNRTKSGDSWQKPIKTSEDLKKFLINNQPYYKKHIPEVFNYFKNKL